MLDRAHIAGIIMAVLLILFILELVRRRRLREEYSLLWLFVGAALLILAIFKPLVNWFGSLVGIYYAPSALFLVGFIFLVILQVNITTVISRLTEQNKDLAQEVALLKNRLEEREKEKSSVSK